MPKHASNAERIARAAAEAEARSKEKKERRTVPGAAGGRPRASRAPKVPPRMKIVWAVGVPGEEPKKTFPYPERAAADAEAARRGGEFRVAPLKVPME